jgi:YVTN family beta-propeller protein
MANLLDNTVSLIDGASNRVVATIPVGSEPVSVGVNPTTNRIYVTNSNSSTMSVIDGASNRVVATIPVGTDPSGVGVNPTTNRIYVANEGSNTVIVVDDRVLVPHDARFFPQTGFRIDNDTIWDYFNRRGGVNTFGYPVSRTFLLQGFQVQFFQRRIVQLAPNGQARLLNVLDPGLLPFTSFNFATFPAFDPVLVATAPNPTDAAATLAFVQAHAPDAFQGLPVHFFQTFRNTVPFAVAFPFGGDASLLPGFDLELWGVPTSNPAFDPNNHSFVYLRFQRGIMHFDARCQCTQGILLADYLKSILTGQNLPPDLNQEAQGSPFFRQYDPSALNWVHNPSLLPNTDLTNAFGTE